MNTEIIRKMHNNDDVIIPHIWFMDLRVYESTLSSPGALLFSYLEATLAFLLMLGSTDGANFLQFCLAWFSTLININCLLSVSNPYSFFNLLLLEQLRTKLEDSHTADAIGLGRTLNQTKSG